MGFGQVMFRSQDTPNRSSTQPKRLPSTRIAATFTWPAGPSPSPLAAVQAVRYRSHESRSCIQKSPNSDR